MKLLILILMQMLAAAPALSAELVRCVAEAQIPCAPTVLRKTLQIGQILKIACEARWNENRCEVMLKSSPEADKGRFFNCNDPGEVCEASGGEKPSQAFACASGSGGVIVDAALGLILLPHTLWEAAKKIPALPEKLKTCYDDFEAKNAYLGLLKPKDMIDQTLKNMGCADVTKFVRTKVDTILAKLEARRQNEMAVTGRENLSVYDMKLSEPEIQALNWDLKNAGPLMRARCYRPEEAAREACEQLTKVSLGVAGGAGVIRLLSRGMPGATVARPSNGFREVFFRGRPESLTSAEIVSVEAAELNAFRAMGAKFEPTTKTSMARAGYEAKQLDILTESGSAVELGTVHRITGLPAPVARGTNKTPALQHPEMAKHLKELKDAGYDLVIDPTKSLIGSEAYFHPGFKTLSIGPKTSWNHFVHEFQHFKWQQHIAPIFDDLVATSAKSKDLVSSLPAETVQAIGLQNLSKIEKLFKKGIIDELATNETLAVQAQLNALGWRQFVPGFGGSTSRSYALLYQIRALEDLAERGAASTKQLQQLKVLRTKQSFEMFGNVSPVPLGLGAATEGYEYGKRRGWFNPSRYKQVLFNDNGTVLGQKEDGTWDTFQPRK